MSLIFVFFFSVSCSFAGTFCSAGNDKGVSGIYLVVSGMNFKVIILDFFIVSVLAYSLEVLPLKAQNESFSFILIKQDGSVEPSSAPITQTGNVYTLTDNVYNPIIIERCSIVLDGAGHFLDGNDSGKPIIGIQAGADSRIGINITASNVNITNINILNWNVGILGAYDGNYIINNSLTECVVGIKVYGSNYRIEWNYIANNGQAGIVLRANRTSIVHNEIAGDQEGIDIAWYNHIIMENNMSNVNFDIAGLGMGGVFIARNNFFKTNPNRYLLAMGGNALWDVGGEGNYWRAYNGTDTNGDGVGDTPFLIGQFFNYETNNDTASGSRIWGIDKFPLMNPITVQDPPQPSPSPKSTSTAPPTPSPSHSPSTTSIPSRSPITAPPEKLDPSPSPSIPEFPTWIAIPITTITVLIIIFLERKKQTKITLTPFSIK